MRTKEKGKENGSEMRTRSYAIAGIVAIAIAFALIAAMMVMPAAAHYPGAVINSNWATTIPTIDGVKSTGEWDDAWSDTVSMNPAVGTSPLEVPLWVKNDGTNLYLAYDVPDTTDDNDLFGILFDNHNDCENGTMVEGPGDEWKAIDPHNVLGAGTFVDGYLQFANIDAVQNGIGTGVWSANKWFFEFEVPLNSGDSQDISALQGETIGFLFVHCQMDLAQEYYWPTTVFIGRAEEFGDLILASEPTPKPDLVVEKSVEFNEDGKLVVSYTVTNIGDGPAGESTTCKYVNDQEMEREPCPALASGASYSGAFEPEECPCGETLNVTVCADNDNVVEESDETNNCEVNIVECPDPWEEINEELDSLKGNVSNATMPSIIKHRLIDKLEYAKALKDNAKEECEAGNFDGATKKLGVAKSQVESFASMVKITRRISSADKASFLADSAEIKGKIQTLIEYIETKHKC